MFRKAGLVNLKNYSPSAADKPEVTVDKSVDKSEVPADKTVAPAAVAAVVGCWPVLALSRCRGR